MYRNLELCMKIRRNKIRAHYHGSENMKYKIQAHDEQ